MSLLCLVFGRKRVRTEDTAWSTSTECDKGNSAELVSWFFQGDAVEQKQGTVFLWSWASACVLGRAPTSCSEAGQGPEEPEVGRDPARCSQLGVEPGPSPSQRVQGLAGGLMGEWLESSLVVLGGLGNLGGGSRATG